MEIRTYVRYALEGIMGYRLKGGRTDVSEYHSRTVSIENAGGGVP